MRKIISIGKTAMLAATMIFTAASLHVPAVAHGEGAVYQERHEFMQGLGKAMKAFSNYLKRGDGEPMELGAMAGDIAENAPNIPSLFPPDTGMAQNEESEAKPDIWENWDDFVAAAEGLVGHAQSLEAAFETGDKGQIGAAVKALGGEGCRGCHQRFREKKE